jgi:hypothetical protein
MQTIEFMGVTIKRQARQETAGVRFRHKVFKNEQCGAPHILLAIRPLSPSDSWMTILAWLARQVHAYYFILHCSQIEWGC